MANSVNRDPAPAIAEVVAADASELALLRTILRALPAAVTVQDGQGDLLLANDAAAAQLNLAGQSSEVAGSDLLRRRAAAGLEVLRSGRVAACEETIADGAGQRVLLTTHRPIRVAERDLLVSSSVDISAHKAIEAELYQRAYFDELTGLPNRGVIERHADRLLQAGTERFALALLDVDNFKHINDYYGHSIGDELLKGIAKRLGPGLRETDILSRISGDEFLLLLSPIQSQSEVVDHLELLLQKLRAPCFIGGAELFASASIGVSLYPEHGRSFEALRQNADLALCRVKSATKGAVAIFDHAMGSEALARMAQEQSLRLAILDKQFCCAFQPKYDIRSREIIGIEALVRLRNEAGVIQAPGAFIDLAVELGLIDELTHLVLAEIMASLDRIDARFGAQCTISINVAAKQAGNRDFMHSFAAALQATGCPQRFIIEVTEDAFVAASLFQTEILPLFRRIGVGVSIDDFGIGYSSLSALADITADEIKIDRSFITGIHQRPRSQGILKAIESLSDALGMTVIAEGIETFEELAYLQAATNIRYAQGYYFSRPIFLEELSQAARPQSDVRPPVQGRQHEPARSGYARSFSARS